MSKSIVMESLSVEKIWSLSGVRSLGNVIQEQIERMEQTGRVIVRGLSINNFLKSQEEIDADFHSAFITELGLEDLRNNRDGYLNTNNPRRIDSGFMEENC